VCILWSWNMAAHLRAFGWAHYSSSKCILAYGDLWYFRIDSFALRLSVQTSAMLIISLSTPASINIRRDKILSVAVNPHSQPISHRRVVSSASTAPSDHSSPSPSPSPSVIFFFLFSLTKSNFFMQQYLSPHRCPF
jgi:hypothetical protein